MQEDVALTETACPLSKSNYDNHASGKAVASRTARQALIRQAAYLNHSSPPLQTPSSANVDGLSKRSPSPLQAPVSFSVMIYSCFTPRNIIFSSSKVSEGVLFQVLVSDISFHGHLWSCTRRIARGGTLKHQESSEGKFSSINFVSEHNPSLCKTL